MIVGRRIRLSEWGRQYGLDRATTWRMLRDGKLPPHIQVERVGRLWYVIIPDEDSQLLTVGYARVSSHEQKPQLEPQANRIWAYAGQNHIHLDHVITEIASGLNDRRPKLHKLLTNPRIGTIVVEHRDRLARFGAAMVDSMLQAKGGNLIVIDDKEVDDDLVRDMTEILTCFCARLYGRRSAASRAAKALQATQRGQSAEETQ